MRPERFTITTLLVLAILTWRVAAAPDPVSGFLSTHGMNDLLEVHLADQIDRARDEDERHAAIRELAAFYLSSLRSMDPDRPERARLISKAWSLSTAYELDELMELRLELLIERYLPIERTVELHQLLLDEPEEAARATKDLSDIDQRLSQIESSLQLQLAQLDRQSRSARTTISDGLPDQIAEVRRKLSLTRYYIGWAGYSRAVLLDRPPAREAIEAFGWLFGAKGQVPTMDDLEHASLEYEHVARAAIGTAMCKALNGDMITARAWLKRIESDHAIDAVIKQQALARRLQVEAIAGQWSEVHEILNLLHIERGEPLQIAESRFVAIRVLEDRQIARGMNAQRERVVRLALEDLIKRGEIGHILDLQQRYGSLPLLADRFISQYASALLALSEAETDVRGGHFLTAASMFAGALKSKDAGQFPSEQLDCTLKLSYCEIRADRPADAIKILDQLILQDPQEPALAEARWLRLVALDLVIQSGNPSLDEQLAKGVLEYILAYPMAPNTAKLMLRHGLESGIDPSAAINALMALPDDDPSAPAAHRMLVQLFHKQYRDSNRSDLAAAMDAIEQAEWVWRHAPDQPTDLADARSRLAIIRMVLDVSLDDINTHRGLITRAILRGLLIVDSDPSLAVFKDEIILRRIQFLLDSENLVRAENELSQMKDQSGIYAQSATSIVFSAALSVSRSDPSDVQSAERVVRIGVLLLEFLLPAAPAPVDANLSAIVSSIALAAHTVATSSPDPDAESLAYRLSKLVLKRGVPDATLLRMSARLAQQRGDNETSLEAWLRLLGQYTHHEAQWHEARYESFRLLLSIDPDRAKEAIDQFRVLYPNPGPDPWGSKIQSLINSYDGGDG